MLDNIFKMLFGDNNSGNNQNGKNNFFSNRSRGCCRCNYNLIPFDQAKDMIESNQVILIDVRTPGEYDIMHIKNAINIPVSEIEKRIFAYEQEKALMVYCSSGTRSKTAIQILNNLGYNNIYIWEYGALATFPYKQMLEYGKNC